jgi:exosortase/archaeosortase family protein
MIKFRSLINDIPLPIRLFLGKALLLFIAWKLVYGIFLYDSNYLDRPLSKHVADASVYVLNNFTTLDGFTSKRVIDRYTYEGEITEQVISAIFHYDNKVLYIANFCNGLELLVLFIGFIICMPSSFLRKTKYIIIGVLLLDGINILRCVGLIYLREYYEVYFDFAHHYLFKAMVYSATLVIWYVFSRKIHLKK